jgi:hypothetical protein
LLRKSRWRRWFLGFLLPFVDLWAAYLLWHAAVEGRIYGGARGHRRWFSIHENPSLFWVQVAINVGALWFCLVVPAYALFRLFRSGRLSWKEPRSLDP